MDNRPIAMSEHRWSPSPVLVALGWVGAVAAGAWFVALMLAGADPTGRLLAAVTTLALLGAALFGLLARPRLTADSSGLTVRGPFRSRHAGWSGVRSIRLLRTRRLGVTGSLLELDLLDDDGRERLVVLGRLDLGADPEEVAATLLMDRPTG